MSVSKCFQSLEKIRPEKPTLWSMMMHVQWLRLLSDCAGSVVLCDVWHAGLVGSRAPEKTGAGRGGAGEKGTVGAPSRHAANQESSSCWTDIQGPASGSSANIWTGAAHRADTTQAEGGVFVCLQSVSAFCSCHKYIRSTSITSAGRGDAQGWDQVPDARLHRAEESGGDGHLTRPDQWEIRQTRKDSCFIFVIFD